MGGLCAGNGATDPDDDEDDYSRSSLTDKLVDEEATAGAPNSGAAVKKKSTDSKYPWVDSEHVVKEVYQHFDIERELGRGASCRVLKVKGKENGKLYAMKEMRRDDKWNPMLFEQECNILKKLSGHQNILHYEDCWMDNKNFYVLTSLCTGGELFGSYIHSIYVLH